MAVDKTEEKENGRSEKDRGMTTPLVLHRQETEARGGSRSGVSAVGSHCVIFISVCVIGGQAKGWRGGGGERERERERERNEGIEKDEGKRAEE